MSDQEKERALAILKAFYAEWDGDPATKNWVWNFPHEDDDNPGFAFASTQHALVRIPKEMLPAEYGKYRGDAMPPPFSAVLGEVWREGDFSAAYSFDRERPCRVCGGSGKVDAPGDKCMMCDGTTICICPDCDEEHVCGCCKSQVFPGHIGVVKKECGKCAGTGVESVPMVGETVISTNARQAISALAEHFPDTSFMESTLDSGWPCVLFRAGEIVGVVMGEKK